MNDSEAAGQESVTVAEPPVRHTVQGKPVDSGFDVRLDYHRTVIPATGDLDKPHGLDFFGRSRDIINDPVNALIRRVPDAGGVDEDGRVILHNGLRVPLVGPDAYYGEFSHLLVVNRGVHEPLEEFLFQQVVDSMTGSPTMIELGAYWAHYSMWMKSRLGDARVIMVEPETVNINAGRNNFERNGLQGEFIQDFVGTGYFEIDAFVTDNHVDHIDILHADIQGYEVDMIDGASQSLGSGVIDRIFVSTHGDDLHQTCLSKLRSFGYQIIAESNFQDTTCWDGIIFATREQRFSPVESFTPCTRLEANAFTSTGRQAYLDTIRRISG